MAQKQDQNTYRDELSPRELSEVVWRGRWLILGVTAAATLVAGLLAALIPNQYQAVVVVSPVSSTSEGGGLGGLGALASQFGGLAALTGITSGQSSRWESLAVLESQALTEKYIKMNNLLPVLYQDQWDAKAGTWKSKDSEEIPSLWKASEYFRNGIMTVSTEDSTGLVEVKITWRDPKMAATWANGLVKLTNDYLREKAIAESERNISYLNEQASKTELIGMKQAIYDLLEREIRNSMLARGREEYALKVLDPAIAPEEPSSPRPLLLAFMGLAGGFFLSVLAVLLRAAWHTI